MSYSRRLSFEAAIYHSRSFSYAEGGQRDPVLTFNYVPADAAPIRFMQEPAAKSQTGQAPAARSGAGGVSGKVLGICERCSLQCSDILCL